MSSDQFLAEIEAKFQESQRLFVAAEDMYSELIRHSAMEKNKFFTTLCQIKAKITEALQLLVREVPTYAFCAQYADRLRDCIDQMQSKELLFSYQLSKILCPEAHRIHVAGPIPTESTALMQQIDKIKRTEHDFLETADSGDSRPFVGMVREYYELSNALSLGLLHFLGEAELEECDSKVYLKLSQTHGLSGQALKDLGEDMDQETALVVRDISESIQKMLDDYYQTEHTQTCLHFVTVNLRDIGKRHDLKHFERNLDQQMQVILGQGDNLKKMLGRFKAFLGKNSFRADAKVFLDIFKSFCQILIELEFDKPDQTFQTNEFYQYGFLLMVFRWTFKAFLAAGLAATIRASAK